MRGLGFNLINTEDSRICKDSNHIKVIKQLRKDIAILKPDTGNGVVLLNNKDYTTSVGNLIKDTKKFKSFESDPTITRMKTLQSYLSTLHKRNELTKEQHDMMRPKNGKLARAHGLPKIHKEYSSIPKFRPIVVTTGTPHYSTGKFLTNLLNQLAMNEFTLKDSFDAVNKIKNIPPHLFDDGYNYVSFDVESLFTNVPIKRTIDHSQKNLC